MAYDPDLLDRLESLAAESWQGTAFRYTAGRRSPEQENTQGARWNPPEVPAIYMALDRETLVAEFEHHLSVLSPRPRRDVFSLYSIRVVLEDVVDLRPAGLLASLGVSDADLAGDDHAACQRVGGAVAWLPRGGILVPSARRPEGTNLVIFPHHQDPNYDFEILSNESMPPSE